MLHARTNSHPSKTNDRIGRRVGVRHARFQSQMMAVVERIEMIDQIKTWRASPIINRGNIEQEIKIERRPIFQKPTNFFKLLLWHSHSQIAAKSSRANDRIAKSFAQD